MMLITLTLGNKEIYLENKNTACDIIIWPNDMWIWICQLKFWKFGKHVK